MRQTLSEGEMLKYSLLPFGFLYVAYKCPTRPYAIAGIIALTITLYYETPILLASWISSAQKGKENFITHLFLRTLPITLILPPWLAFVITQHYYRILTAWPEFRREWQARRILGLYPYVFNTTVLV